MFWERGRWFADIVAEITAASEEQSQGIEQINRAVSQMDEVTQQNAALVEQAAAAAESLDEQATKLKGAVSVFKIAGAGSQRSPVAVIAAQAAPVTAAIKRLPQKPLPTPRVHRPALTSVSTSPEAAAQSGWDTF